MTRLVVESGICGFSVIVSAEKNRDRSVKVSLETECEMVQNMLADIATLDMNAVFTRHLNNPVYQSASKHLKHVACPVPAAVLKALEVELGLCIPKNVSFVFTNER